MKEDIVHGMDTVSIGNGVGELKEKTKHHECSLTQISRQTGFHGTGLSVGG